MLPEALWEVKDLDFWVLPIPEDKQVQETTQRVAMGEWAAHFLGCYLNWLTYSDMSEGGKLKDCPSSRNSSYDTDNRHSKWPGSRRLRGGHGGLAWTVNTGALRTC